MRILHFLLTPLLMIISMMLAVSQQHKAANIPGKIVFKNGNSLTGKIIQWSPKAFTLSSPYLVDPISFPHTRVAHIKNTQQEMSLHVEAANTATITLKKHASTPNSFPHDSLIGSLTEITATHIKLNTTFAGILNVKRSDIETVDILHNDEVIYRGPKDLEEWKIPNPKFSWKFENGSLISGTSYSNIVKQVNLPDLTRIQLNCSWVGNPQFYLRLYSSSLKDKPKHFYRLNFLSTSLSFAKSDSSVRRGVKYLKMVNKSPHYYKLVQQLRKDQRAQLDIYVDKKKGLFSIYYNNEFFSSYKDDTPLPENYGSAIHLISMPKSSIAINKLNIYKWNAHLPASAKNKTHDPILGKGTTITMKNGDSIIGEMGESLENQIEVKTKLTTLNASLKGIKSIYFDSKKLPSKIEKKEDILLWFNNKQAVRVKPLECKGNLLKVIHPSFGEALFNLEYFKKFDLIAL